MKLKSISVGCSACGYRIRRCGAHFGDTGATTCSAPPVSTLEPQTPTLVAAGPWSGERARSRGATTRSLA